MIYTTFKFKFLIILLLICATDFLEVQAIFLSTCRVRTANTWQTAPFSRFSLPCSTPSLPPHTAWLGLFPVIYSLFKSNTSGRVSFTVTAHVKKLVDNHELKACRSTCLLNPTLRSYRFPRLVTRPQDEISEPMSRQRPSSLTITTIVLGAYRLDTFLTAAEFALAISRKEQSDAESRRL